MIFVGHKNEKRPAGRPKMDENVRRSKGLRIRLTPEEHFLVKKYAELYGLSASESIRRIAVCSAKINFERLQKDGVVDENFERVELSGPT